MRIVLVDQDSLSLMQLEAIMKKSNPKDETLIFNDVYMTLEYIKRNMVNEIFIEISMKGKTGLTLAKEIKKINRQVKVILIADSEEYAIEAWKVHADYFLVKPITLETIHKMRE